MRYPLLTFFALLVSRLAFADAAIPIPGDAARITDGKAPIRGERDAKLTIVEYADFQCPYSARVTYTLGQLQKKYGRELRLVFHHMPLPFHDNAHGAAEAAVAARAQGKFWPMHDRLFDNYQHLARADLEKYAQEIGLDLPRFRAALAGGEPARAVDEDVAWAKQIGVSGTPTFYINGRQLVGAQPEASFVKVLDEELIRADAELARGTSREKLYDILVATAPKPTP